MNAEGSGPALAAKVSSAVRDGGAGIAFFGGLTNVELAAYGGLIVAILGFIVNTAITWHFKAAHLRLAKKNQAEMYDE